MSHVDEGTLHAYLDGELSPAERAGLEQHIAQCATCRTQLAEERTLLERSAALLGSARPLERAVPPFEQLRRAPRRPWYLRTGFAWAASLILAVGFGYYLSDQFSPLPRAATPVREPAAVGQVAAPRQEIAQAQKSVAGRRPAAQPEPAAAAPAVTPAENSHRLIRDSQAAAAIALRGATPQPVDTVHRRQDSARARANALEEAPVTAAPPAAFEGQASAGVVGRRSAKPSVRDLVSTTWPLISRGKAASLLGDRPVGVPGLATRGIHSSPAGDGTVVVEQTLDSKTVIQIFQRPASTAEADELARERGDRVLARYVGRLRVEIAGPVSTDSLNKLLEQVEPIP